MASRHNYGDDPSQYGVLYGEGPVAVVIHGGFWKAAYGLDLGRPLAADLAGGQAEVHHRQAVLDAL